MDNSYLHFLQFQKLKKENENGMISTDVQKNILNNTVNNILIKQYPVKYSYQRAFIKLLIGEVLIYVLIFKQKNYYLFIKLSFVFFFSFIVGTKW